eukprot:277686_1
MMQLVKTVSKTAVYPGPVVQLYPSDNAFTVSNVRNYADFEVDAPSLEYQILEAGPALYRVEYQPTAKHQVKLSIGGGEIARFAVTTADTGPALLEGSWCCGGEDLEKKAKDLITELGKAKPADEKALNVLKEKATALAKELGDAAEKEKDEAKKKLNTAKADVEK